MFWVRKAAAAAAATLALLVAGFGAGLSVQQAPDAVAQEKENAMKQPDPPAPPEARPYIVFTVRGTANMKEIYTITEYDARGKCRWSVIPGREQAEVWATTKKLADFDSDAVIGGARDYLTRVKKDAAAPRELRVVLTNDVQLGGFTMAALEVCRDAGFDTIKLTGYLPSGGGFIPELQPGPNGEAPGYKRYRGEPVETKKLVADYERTMRSF